MIRLRDMKKRRFVALTCEAVPPSSSVPRQASRSPCWLITRSKKERGPPLSSSSSPSAARAIVWFTCATMKISSDVGDPDPIDRLNFSQRDGEHKKRSHLRRFCHYPHRGVDAGHHSCKQCCGSGSGIRCLFDPWIRDPE
jgi:hypothetical protein